MQLTPFEALPPGFLLASASDFLPRCALNSDFHYRRRHRNRRHNLTRALAAVNRNLRSSLAQAIQTDMRGDAVEPAANGLLVPKHVAVTICP